MQNLWVFFVPLPKFRKMQSDYLVDQEYNNQNFDDTNTKFKEFENCTFHHCDFRNCTFQTVSFVDCNFFDCNFQETKLNYVSLRGVFFTKCNFTAVNFAMTDQVIYEFHFKDCLLDYTQFYALKLKKMQFINCSMISADFMGSDLTEVLFDNCNLRRTVYIDSVLHKTDFSTSYDYTLDLDKNKIKKPIFSSDGLRGLLEKYDIVVK